jgi:hypothetical protein
MKNELAEPVYWGMTELAHKVAQAAMENRAIVESAEVENGQDINKIHGQALRDYAQFEQLIGGAFGFLKKIGHPAVGIAADMGLGIYGHTVTPKPGLCLCAERWLNDQA